MRNKRLDVLRCGAVVAVMIHHSNYSYLILGTGWLGVDLFFVLSGFLISGLLFSEYKKRDSISFRTFFIRRGLKIYPSFYLFLLLTGIAGQIVFHNHAPLAHYLRDIFFIMNYGQGVWDHTWSLGVEEHFYVFLPLFLLLLVRFSTNRQDPFRILPWATLVVGICCLISRMISVDLGTPNFHMAGAASHNRVDSLFFGVLLGYFYHFRPMLLERVMRPNINRVAIALCSVTLISVAYFCPIQSGSKFLVTIGYTFVYLGFGGILLLSLYVRDILPNRIAGVPRRIGSASAYIGVYSYSIYLWHGPTGAWFPGLLRRTIHFPTTKIGVFSVYFIASLVIGITMSRLIEYPILRLRDRLFPQPQVVAVNADVAVTSTIASAGQSVT
jgi:peptidoglycan/LPS O-acetylase OafA/YrhL